MPPHPSTRSRAFAIGLLALGCLGFASAWILLAAWLDRPCSWMAVVAGIDAAVLLRITRVRPSMGRMLLGVSATAAMIILALWGIAAARIGGPLGLMPWESLMKMGPEFGWLLVRLGTTPADLAWFATGLLVAAWASK